MATTADIKIGMCIEMDGKTFQIVDFQHVKPGKGPAFVRTKLKNLESGRVLDNTFSAGAKIEPVRVERRPYQFTYEDDLGAHFMHTETFEEINIDKNLITNTAGTVLGYEISRRFSFPFSLKSVDSKGILVRYEPVLILAVTLLVSMFLKPIVSDSIWNIMI